MLGEPKCLDERPAVQLERPDSRESGAEEIRTPDLIIANDALYQLSYRPMGPEAYAAIIPATTPGPARGPQPSFRGRNPRPPPAGLHSRIRSQ